MLFSTRRKRNQDSEKSDESQLLLPHALLNSNRKLDDLDAVVVLLVGVTVVILSYLTLKDHPSPSSSTVLPAANSSLQSNLLSSGDVSGRSLLGGSLEAVRAVLYESYPSGFRERLVGLIVLCSIGLMLSLIAIMLCVKEAIGRDGDGIWLFRKAPRRILGGSYIVTNLPLISTLTSCLSLSLLVYLLFAAYSAQQSDSKYSPLSIFSPLPFLLITLHAWFISWSLFQDYLCEPLDYFNHQKWVRKLTHPSVANTLFVVGSAAGGIGLLTLGLVTTFRLKHLTTSFIALETSLQSYSNYSTPLPPELALFVPLYGTIFDVSVHFYKFKSSSLLTWFSVSVFLFITLLVLISSTLLALLYHHESLVIRTSLKPLSSKPKKPSGPSRHCPSLVYWFHRQLSKVHRVLTAKVMVITEDEIRSVEQWEKEEEGLCCYWLW